MFTIPKTDFPRQFHVYSNHVTELLGNYFSENGEHYQPCEYEEDLQVAIDQAVAFREMEIDKDIWFLERAISNGKWFKFWIKSFWNPKIKKALSDHYTKLKVLNAFSMGHSTDDVVVELMPDDITFAGDKLEIGTTLFMVNMNSLTIRTSEITGYDEWDFQNGKLYFRNTLNFNINSLSFCKEDSPLEKDKRWRANTWDNPVFLDETKAEFTLKEAIKTRMAELADQAKQIGN